MQLFGALVESCSAQHDHAPVREGEQGGLGTSRRMYWELAQAGGWQNDLDPKLSNSFV